MIDFNRYNNFLENKDIYLENKKLYQKLINKISTETSVDWVVTKYANGEEIGNGNPIYSTYFEGKKLAIRIIQLKKDIGKPYFNAWINKNPFEIDDSKELVISLQLKQDTFEDLSYIIEAFINKTISNSVLTFLNNKYHKIWNEDILSKILEKIKNDNNLNYILHSDFDSKIPTPTQLKQSITSFENIFSIFLISYKFPHTQLNTSIKELKSATEKLYDVLTIKQSIENLKHINSQSIIRLIDTKFSSVNNFKSKLKNSKNRFSNKLIEIEHLID